MTIGSLFSGIGGLELGLEWAGLGPVLWQVEIDPKCRNCLATHWPNAKRFEDVRTVGKEQLEPVDLICGGFPCQDVSSAGKRAGLSGARSGLWTEFARIISELRPQFVVVENVASGAEKWVDAIRLELERIGYGSLPVPLAASDVGAWHRRERIFVVAHGNGVTAGRLPERTAAAIPRPGIGSQIFPDTNSKLREGSELQRERHDERTRTSDHRGWAVEPDVARVVHGLPGRVDRVRALGNAVVPQCAEVIGEVINFLRM